MLNKTFISFYQASEPNNKIRDYGTTAWSPSFFNQGGIASRSSTIDNLPFEL